MPTTRDFGAVIRRRVEDNPKLSAAVETEKFNAEVAMQIYDARKRAGLTQQQLAEQIDTRQSVIARLEDADYSGHSLSMLRKIASATGCSLRIELLPAPQNRTGKAHPSKSKRSRAKLG
jgi:ribosome-binding protein aMBF1 (putative translation factor)